MAFVLRHRRPHLLLLAVWFVVVLVTASHHVVWRDEVRALSLAQQGHDVMAMLTALHGEGHPAVWYLLLRGAYTLVRTPKVLPIVALLVACGALLLLVLRSPFGLPVLALLLWSRFAVFEYAVMARNYGISMLLLFVIAAVYDRHRAQGILLGVLLFCLANCNIHSVLLVGAFLLFWLLDMLREERRQRAQALKTVLGNAAIALLGVVLCLLTVFPSYNDAALLERPDGLSGPTLRKALVVPAGRFRSLTIGSVPPRAMERLLRWVPLETVRIAFSLVMFGSTLGLVRRPGAVLAALVALAGFSLLFTLVYPGDYRHQALWLTFLVSLYWIVGAQSPPQAPARSSPLPPRLRPVARIGSALFGLLLVLQVHGGIVKVTDTLRNQRPLSRSRDLAAFVASRPDLHEAVIMAEPDFLVEPLPFYLTNRLYLMREHRFGTVVRFTRQAQLRLTLDEILGQAHRLRVATGGPVLILLHRPLDPALPPQRYKEGYNWEFVTTPEQVRTFQASTRLLASFRPAVTDESFDVYVLD